MRPDGISIHYEHAQEIDQRVEPTRTAVDGAEKVRLPADRHEAETVALVMDNR